MDVSLQKSRRVRVSRGRSHVGCLTCKARHIKCDETHPNCRRCTRVGRECIWGTEQEPEAPSGYSILVALTTQSHKPLEVQLFHQYISVTAPNLDRIEDAAFFKKIVPAVAHNHDHIYRAAIAVVSLSPFQGRELSGEKMDRGTFEQGLRNYSMSVSKSIQVGAESTATLTTVGNLSLTLVAMILYIFIELRLGQLENVETLAKIAFKFIKNNQFILTDSKDVTVLCCLNFIAAELLVIAVDPLCIPKPHRDAAIAVALALIDDLGWKEIHKLKIELSWLMCEVLDYSVNADASSFDLSYRLNDWYRRMVKYSGQSDRPLNDQECLNLVFSYRLVHLQWMSLQDSINQKSELRKSISEVLNAATDLASSIVDGKTIPDWLLFAVIYPSCLLSAWYWQNEEYLPRMRSLITRYARHDGIRMKNVLCYIQELISSPGETETERLLFHGRPKMLQLRHGCIFAVALIDGKGIHQEVDLTPTKP